MACLMDTGFWFASIDESDTHHERVVKATKNIREQVIVPSPAITETAYLVRRNLGVERLAKFSEKLNSTKFQIESPTGNDYIRIAAVLRKYNDVNIDFVDACIVAMAERLNITNILTIDRRHFGIFKPVHCDSFEILPETL